MTKPLLDMTVTSPNHPHTILVTVEMDEGVVSYAEIEHSVRGKPAERCYVTTADRTVRWEWYAEGPNPAIGDCGDWKPAKAEQVSWSADIRKAMANAAFAGLRAAGRAS